MLKRLLGGVVVALALVAAAAPATAQSASGSDRLIVVTRPPDYEARADLVRRYFAAIQFEKLTTGMMESMLAGMDSDPRIPADKRELVRQSAMEAFGEVMPQMVEATVEVYAVEFSLDELPQLVAFYESPVGRSMTTKAVMLAQRSNEIFGRFQPLMEQEMMRRLCARTDCGAAAPAATAGKPR